eukprot:6708206-Lingulodinium_polyedra.AAC.1
MLSTTRVEHGRAACVWTRATAHGERACATLLFNATASTTASEDMGARNTTVKIQNQLEHCWQRHQIATR